MLACRILLPLAIAADDFQQFIHRLFPGTAAIKHKREVKPRLQISRIGCHCGTELFEVARCGRTLLQRKFGFHRAITLVRCSVRPDQPQGLPGPVDVAAFEIAARQSGDRFGISGVFLKHLSEQLRRA